MTEAGAAALVAGIFSLALWAANRFAGERDGRAIRTERHDLTSDLEIVINHLRIDRDEYRGRWERCRDEVAVLRRLLRGDRDEP